MSAVEKGLERILHPLNRDKALGVPEATTEPDDKELRLTQAAQELGQQSIPHAVAPPTEVPPADHVG